VLFLRTLKTIKKKLIKGDILKKKLFNGKRLEPLRCTLKGFKINYQIKIHSNQLNFNKLYLSTLKDKSKLNPWFITSLIDAEGSFIVRLYKNQGKLGWAVQSIFTIGLHERDLDLLLQEQQFFWGELVQLIKVKIEMW
jgi:hypothetical protein